jgi:hypothetical protein
MFFENEHEQPVGAMAKRENGLRFSLLFGRNQTVWTLHGPVEIRSIVLVRKREKVNSIRSLQRDSGEGEFESGSFRASIRQILAPS